MKLIIAIVHDEYSDSITRALTQADYRVTAIASTGGFLRRGRTTLLCGVEDDKYPQAVEVIRGSLPPATTQTGTRCTLFVVNVTESYRF